MITKKFKLIGLASILMVSVMGTTALANNIFDKPVREYISLGEDKGFDALLKKAKREIPKDEEIALRAAYDKALAMEESGDEEEATSLWGEFREAFGEYTKDQWYEGLKEQPDFSDFKNFEDFLKGMEFKGSDDENDTLKRLYEEGLEIEARDKGGEELQQQWTLVYRIILKEN